MRVSFKWLAVVTAAIIFAVTGPAQAVNPDEMLDDPVLEERARELSKILRCVVCRNQNIDDSNAKLAKDFRILLRERLVAGDSDEQAVGWLVDRYGSYILLKPPVTARTVLLWIGPLALLITATLGFWLVLRKRPIADDDTSDFSDADRQLISTILNDEVSK